jgi:hypothetical protein
VHHEVGRGPVVDRGHINAERRNLAVGNQQPNGIPP